MIQRRATDTARGEEYRRPAQHTETRGKRTRPGTSNTRTRRALLDDSRDIERQDTTRVRDLADVHIQDDAVVLAYTCAPPTVSTIRPPTHETRGGTRTHTRSSSSTRRGCSGTSAGSACSRARRGAHRGRARPRRPRPACSGRALCYHTSVHYAKGGGRGRRTHARVGQPVPADLDGRGVGLRVELEAARLVRADADHVARERAQPLDHGTHLRERRQEDVDLRTSFQQAGGAAGV